MRQLRSAIGGALALLILACHARAADLSPLRALPRETDVVLKINNPRELVESITSLELVKQLQTLGIVEELLNSTQARRFFQFIEYYERAMGAPYPKLLEAIAGNGMALGLKIGGNPPVVLSIEGTDPAKVKQFTGLAIKTLEQELERQGVRNAIQKKNYEGADVYQIGNDLYIAQHKTTILLTNNKNAGKTSLDLVLGKSKQKTMADHKGFARAEKMLPKTTMGMFWVNMESVRKQPGAEEAFATPREPFLQVILGSWLTILEKAAFVCGGLGKIDRGFIGALRFAGGTKHMGAIKEVYLPSKEDASRSRPILSPKGTIFSTSFYWDLAQYWLKRKEIFGDINAKNFEQLDKNAGQIPFLKVQPSKLLTLTGPYHRLVVVNQKKSGYEKYPDQTIPSFAFITEPRDLKGFKQAVEPLIRSGAFFATTQIGWKMKTKEYKGCKIVGYRFNEKRAIPGDETNLRFNASPCFFTCGKQFAIASTMELAEKLIDELKEEESKEIKAARASSTVRINSGALLSLVQSGEEQLVTQTVLDQGVSVAEAKKQVKKLFQLIRQTGGISTGEIFLPGQYQYNVRFMVTRPSPKKTK